MGEGDDGVELWVRAIALSEDGELSVRQSLTGPVEEAGEVGHRLAASMLADGAAELRAAHDTDGATEDMVGSTVRGGSRP